MFVCRRLGANNKHARESRAACTYILIAQRELFCAALFLWGGRSIGFCVLMVVVVVSYYAILLQQVHTDDDDARRQEW